MIVQSSPQLRIKSGVSLGSVGSNNLLGQFSDAVF
jgi:hypothetical protein